MRRAALMLDSIGRAYGVRPSQIAGISPNEGKSILFDLKILGVVSEELKQENTLSGQIQRKRDRYPKEVKRELKEMGQWR